MKGAARACALTVVVRGATVTARGDAAGVATLNDWATREKGQHLDPTLPERSDLDDRLDYVHR